MILDDLFEFDVVFGDEPSFDEFEEVLFGLFVWVVMVFGFEIDAAYDEGELFLSTCEGLDTSENSVVEKLEK